MQGLLYFLLLIFAPAAFGGPFDPPPTDESVTLLGIIFSGSVGSIYLGGGQPNPVIADLMEKFNFVIVVGGIIIVSYVAILSTINTAQEGSVMGKRWSAIWIPMRSVAGMALLIPAPSTGYSMIQVTVMWIVLQGIGAADALWNIALEGLASGVSASMGTRPGAIALNALQTNGKKLVQPILDAAVCMQSLYQLSTQPSASGTFAQQYGQTVGPFNTMAQNNPTSAADPKGDGNCYSVSGTVYFGVNNNVPQDMNVCGSVPIISTTCPSDYTTWSTPPTPQQLVNDAVNMYNVKVNAISSMLSILNPIAIGYATDTYASPFVTNTPLGTQAPAGGYNAAANAYASNMYSLVVPNGAQFGNVTNPAAAAAAGQVTQAANATAAQIAAGATAAGSTLSTGIQNNAGTIGGVAGAVVGSVGAVPGAIAGATVGSYLANKYAQQIGSGAGSALTATGQSLASTVSEGGQLVGGLINSAGGNTQNVTSTSATLNAAIQQGMLYGWISAGSFYFIFNRSFTSTLFASATNDAMPGAATAPSCATGGACISNINTSTGLANGNAQPDNATNLDNATNTTEQNIVAANLAAGDQYLTNDQSTSVSSQLNFTVPNSNAGATFSTVINSFTSFGVTALNELELLFNNLGCVPGTSYNVPNSTQNNQNSTATTQTCGQMDPLMAHAKFGSDLMSGCEGVFTGVLISVVITLVTLSASSVAASFIPFYGIGIAYALSGTMVGTIWLMLGVLSWVFPLLAWLWAFGAMLAIYMPLIPFMIFTMGALGWMLAIVEAVIAAPIVAIGIIMPSEHEMGELKHALMILANIFLRPMLMIFGFILASGVYRAIISLIDFGIGSVFQTIAISTLFSFVVVVSVYITFVLSVTNVSFSLIYAIPDRILRWIGGGEEHTGAAAEKAMGEVKGAADRSGQMVGGALAKATQATAKVSRAIGGGGLTGAWQGKGFLGGGISAGRKAIFGSGADAGDAGGASGRSTSGNTSGTNTSGNTSGTNTSGNTSGTNTSGNTSGTNTSGTNTSGTNTSGTNTSGTNTSGTNTSGTNTSGTNTSGNTSGTNTSGTNTSGTNTSGNNNTNGQT